ncbi:MAG TPA: hypothetical protein VHW60_22640 [Caulobacteraceae bacterium]|jgi:hypothetical protein|nr:hypothetical protein [Caulobacteraceae bacterium]
MDPQSSDEAIEPDAALAEWRPPTLVKLPANLAETLPKSAVGNDGGGYS